MKIIIIALAVALLLSGCDSLRVVSLNDEGYKTILNDCGENQFRLLNGLSPDSYIFEMGTSYEAKVNTDNLYIVFDSDSVNLINYNDGYNGSYNNKNIQWWINFAFTGKNFDKTETIKIHLDNVLTCNGVSPKVEDIVLSPPTIWSN